jgi:hypothetical protein
MPDRAGSGRAEAGLESLVRFERVGRTFGDRAALRDLDLEVREREVLGLIGPNGAGKTTALRILCGLLEPTSGRATIGGHDTSTDPLEARKLISFVPDGAPLYANLSPRQHLALVGRLHGLDEERIESEGTRLLDALDLAERADDPVGTFSRGMRQKDGPRLRDPAEAAAARPRRAAERARRADDGRLQGGSARVGGPRRIRALHVAPARRRERVCDRIAILAEDPGRGRHDGRLRALAGRDGTLEQVFGALTKSEDPRGQAERLLG